MIYSRTGREIVSPADSISGEFLDRQNGSVIPPTTGDVHKPA
jgi:hypothetical protein